MGLRGSLKAMFKGGIASFVVGCVPADFTTTPPVSPLVYDARALARSSKIALFVPGAFASTDIFENAAFWADEGYALVHYRFPGRDGLDEDHALDIDVAGGLVADFLARYPDHDAVLVGYSTGGPIVLTAAHLSRERPGNLAVALISPAVERAGGLRTRLRGFGDVLASALRARSFRTDQVWRAYWQVLLYGRGNVTDPEFAERIDHFTATDHPLLTPPTPTIAELHTRALSRWTLPVDFTLGDTPLAMFVGRADPVFSQRQSQAFAARLGIGQITSYPDEGHMPFLTQPRLFHDVLAFADQNLNSTQ